MKRFSSTYQKEMCNIALVCEPDCFGGVACSGYHKFSEGGHFDILFLSEVKVAVTQCISILVSLQMSSSFTGS